VIKARFGGRLDAWIHTLLPFLFRREVNPNHLTVIGATISIAAAVAFALGRFPLGGFLLLAGGFFDLIDGVVARHHGRSTAFGAFLDSTMDRFVDMVVLFGIVMHYARAGQAVMVLVVGVVLVMSVMTSYAKARAEQVVPHLGGGILERGERIGLLAAGSILGWLEPILWVLAAGTTFTALQRFSLAYRALERRTETGGEKREGARLR
jgi:CDP-diacylglycerol--glycerol-3-phosphate 3-phosphatidyltransferase